MAEVLNHGKTAMLRLTLQPGVSSAVAVAGAMKPFFDAHPGGVSLKCHACGWRGDWKRPQDVPTKTLPCPAIDGRFHVKIDG